MPTKKKYTGPEHSACGVGFIASRNGTYSHDHLQQGLNALRCVEHRGACSADGVSGDGAGIMTDIPFELFGHEKDTIAVATLFLSSKSVQLRKALSIFEETFGFMGMEVLTYRDVPVDLSVLGQNALDSAPVIKQAIIKRPARAKTNLSFDKRLYFAKQHTRTKLKAQKLEHALYFTSLSAQTIVYKAMCKAEALPDFYLDLNNPNYKTRFCLFHRRFSTNTTTSWDKAQPFRLVGHNGEINTIAGNRSWAKSREKMLGVEREEIITRKGISDSGSLNEMVEALRYRGSIPNVEDILAIMMPPATDGNDFYRFWSRAMEPWDGPAFITYANGYTIGARLDRNGFRPCRWVRTDSHFYLSSEAGTFSIDELDIEAKGTLYAGRGVTLDLHSGTIFFRDPSYSKENVDATFDARVQPIPEPEISEEESLTDKLSLFGYTQEDIKKVLTPMIAKGKEPIGSMGDTARLAVLSSEKRSFFDFFFQHFAQVTNPPLDYLREKVVTDLNVFLGKKPNILEPKELIPAAPAYALKSPFLSLSQMQFLRARKQGDKDKDRIIPFEISTTFNRSHGVVGFKNRLGEIAKEAVEAVKNGHAILILSDRSANTTETPLPALLALRSVVNRLNDEGLKLNTSVVCDTGEVRSTHQAAALIGFGAQAICPYLALHEARTQKIKEVEVLTPLEREKSLLTAFEHGLLKVMSKSGISVARSYVSAKLFSVVGLGKNLVQTFFPGVQSPIGGLEIDELAVWWLEQTEDADALSKGFLFKEHARGKEGERHSMTNTRSKVIHELVQNEGFSLTDFSLFEEYLKLGYQDEPVALRHLLAPKGTLSSVSLDKVEPIERIMPAFGSGAMSFGAISAESQRDIFEAMKEVGGRSNSGEGGENPYFFTHGIGASVKQIASGRFGVTAAYLVAGDEIQIKVAQGAKPGEGGQLMGVKVTPDIAKARFANPGFDLISPPPLHDIYSIEDLKQLIHDLKQLHPAGNVSVKLVSGVNIGTIAVGVAKAGADIIQISGGEGGTGAASLSSMKHAGLPWEIGLLEAHQALIENGLRDQVILRTDGGLSSGRDIVIASLLGAEQFDFGKLLLIAEGCVMARICEKNTCPRGIATHDPKFKAKYQGTKEHVVRLLNIIAEDVRRELAEMGVTRLSQTLGKLSMLEEHPAHRELIDTRNLDLSYFLDAPDYAPSNQHAAQPRDAEPLNDHILTHTRPLFEEQEPISHTYAIVNTDRSIPAALAGQFGSHSNLNRANNDAALPTVNLTFEGSAGQSFGVFQTRGMNLTLVGEANDSVCKSMSGGKTVIKPSPVSTYDPKHNVIIGNGALYGATGGTLYVHGQAGDRFAVRNSGAIAVVEGTGLHACEYMTNGIVVNLGASSHNIGSGMTGGTLYMFEDHQASINASYISETPLTVADAETLLAILTDYHTETGSKTARYIVEDWDNAFLSFKKYVPSSLAEAPKDRQQSSPSLV
ncbi:MAG: glutamate synthase large subunit [Bacteroidota bacterium]